ncbi:MAG: hypothetical protein ABIB61_00025 [Candidatus Shapirobacteria bacterium]
MMDKKTKTDPVKKINKTFLKIISWLVGSWWGVLLHAAWFGFWLTYDFNLNILTMAVSLEAIFIGIFLLMSSSEAEAERDRREYAAQRRSGDIIDRLLDMETKIEKQQQQILKILSDKFYQDEKIEK